MSSSQDDVPECCICLGMFIDPVRLECRHAFCRLCLVQCAHMATLGRKCPVCRELVITHVDDAFTLEGDAELTAQVAKFVDPEEHCRLESDRAAELTELKLIVRTHMELPVHWDCSIARNVGDAIKLTFESEHMDMVQHMWEGRRMMVYCFEMPRAGVPGLVVLVDDVTFNAHMDTVIVVGRASEHVLLGATWYNRQRAHFTSEPLFFDSADDRELQRALHASRWRRSLLRLAPRLGFVFSLFLLGIVMFALQATRE